jgi:ribonuclease HI
MPRSGEVVRRDYWVSEPATTNNRMALRSVIEAFRILSAKGRSLRVIFYSDSQYIVTGMREWVHGWASRGWRRKGGEIGNLALWREACEAARTHEVQWEWVAGHAGHPQNEYANDLAVRAAREQTDSGGAVASRWMEWLEAQQSRGRVLAALDAFPDGAAFQPSRTLPGAGAGRL